MPTVKYQGISQPTTQQYCRPPAELTAGTLPTQQSAHCIVARAIIAAAAQPVPELHVPQVLTRCIRGRFASLSARWLKMVCSPAVCCTLLARVPSFASDKLPTHTPWRACRCNILVRMPFFQHVAPVNGCVGNLATGNRPCQPRRFEGGHNCPIQSQCAAFYRPCLQACPGI
jgi:hypothetical protein